MTRPTKAALLDSVNGATPPWPIIGVATATADDATARLHVLHGGWGGDEYGALVHRHSTINLFKAISVRDYPC